MALRRRILKDGTEHLYNGRFKATKDQVKQYFRETPDADFSNLNKADKRTAIAIKAGKARAQTGTRVGGSFIPDDIARINKRAAKYGRAVDFEALLKGLGVKTLKEAFKKNPALKEPLMKVITGEALEMWYDIDNTIKVIESFTGSILTVNTIKVTKSMAKSLCVEVYDELNRIFNFMGQSQKLVFIGIDKLEISNPNPSDYDFDGVTPEDFNDIEFKQMKRYQIYNSDPKKDEKQDDKSKPAAGATKPRRKRG